MPVCQAVRSRTTFGWTKTVLTQLQQSYDEQSRQPLVRVGYGDTSRVAETFHKNLLNVRMYVLRAFTLRYP